MSEVTDLVMPVLRKIQNELASLRAKVNDVAETTLRSEQRLEALETYTTYDLGMIGRHAVELEEVRALRRGIQARVAALETSRS